MFVHFLITRFNIVQDWYKTANRNDANIQSEEWLEERFRLYEQYCFPSVANQDTNNFVWFVLFNSETPDKYKHQISQFQKKCKMFTPVFLEPYGDEATLIQNLIDEYITSDTTHIITTRLDNDDMIRKDYISMVQSYYKQNEKDLFLNYSLGYQFDEYQKLLYICPNQDQGHYISRIVLVENRKNTVLVDHSIVASLAKYVEMDISSGPAWIETVHKCNAWNQLVVSKPLYNEISYSDYPELNLSYSTYIMTYIRWIISHSYRWFKRKIEKHIILRIRVKKNKEY